MVGAIDLFQRIAKYCRLRKNCEGCEVEALRMCPMGKAPENYSNEEIAEVIRKIDAATKDIKV